MKKRLGSIPKGLEWISQQIETTPNPSIMKINSDQIPASKRGLSQDLIRATFIMQQDHLEKIKAYAYWERIQIKDVLSEMCDQFFQHKKVRSISHKKDK